MDIHSLPFNGQVLQDKFVVSVLKAKTEGFFLEIGSNDPRVINNTFVLEDKLGWKGVMIEYDPRWLPEYKDHRPMSTPIIQDATTVDYPKVLMEAGAPFDIDYLQIDLEVSNRSTLTTLETLDQTVFDTYRFAVITFEHDVYKGNWFDTRTQSRSILDSRGYLLVFPDVRNEQNAFEDWYVHPQLVDMNYISRIRSNESLEYREISRRLQEL